MKLKPENAELQRKIMTGIRKAVDNMIIKSAADDEQLVIADGDGKVKYVPAKDLLAKRSQ